MTENVATKDKFAKYLGAEIVETKDNYAKVKLRVCKDFLNGIETAHGGMIFSLADYAFALAANTTGETGVAVSANIQYVRPAFDRDEICAEVGLISRTRRMGTFAGNVTNQNNEILAHFSATAFFKDPVPRGN